MKRTLCRAVLAAAGALLVGGASLWAQTEEVEGQKWAAVIGVNDYAELEDLQYCKADATALRDRLVQGGFPEENVFLLADGAVDARELPLKSNIERRIREVLRAAEPGDLVLVSFSGHGMHLDGKTYLCPTGAMLEKPEETMIALADVYRNLEASRASYKLLWVDACRDDPRPKGSKSAAAHARSVAGLVESLKASPEGILTLASCRAGQVSWEEPEFGHGVFMHYLLEGSAGKADQEERGNRDRCVSLLELYNYANIKTRRYTLHNRPKVQTPELFGRITGDIDLFDLFDFLPPDTAKAPFDAAAAARHQAAWAKHLGVPVEYTNSIGMKLRLIPPGEFMMGSPEDEDGRDDDEGPRHRVRITRPFYLGVYEVTQAEYERVMGANPSAFPGSGDSSDRVSGQDTSRVPVESVSWKDAMEFCRRLSALPAERSAGRVYRLPTEAEWEYGCRAGTITPFHFGSVLNGRQANCDGRDPYGTDEKGPDLDRTTTVGSYPPNGFGLYDMHGNVWEWCADWYDGDYYAVSPVDDPTGPGGGRHRVGRGGGWRMSPGYCRSADRDGSAPGNRFNSILGFRLASSVVDAASK